MSKPFDAEIEILWEIKDWAEMIAEHGNYHGISRWYPDWWLHGVPFRPSQWIDDLTGAQRKAFSRAVAAMEEGGSISTIRGPSGRVTHIRPTAALLAEFREMLDAEDAAKVLEGVRRSRWGQSVLNEMSEVES